ncbi:MAG TPA: fatty acid desaturase [Ignavibacteriaceae bacterium]|nr:fatty acid desaturase [Ignavibacteriaceae bacterium]
MKNKQSDFIYSDQSEPHKARTKEILIKHPEVRKLIGRNPLSLFIILFALALQLSIALLLSGQPWWLALIAAYFVGSFANHSLYVMIHEATHNLIFKNRTANLCSGIAADLVNVAPGAISFRTYHLKHHSFQGVYDLDADLPSRWEAKLIGNSSIGKALWLLFFPVFQAFRPIRLKEIKFASKWTFVNWFFVFLTDALVIILFGWNSFLYLVFSFFFSIGLHPLGARWIQEHYLTRPPQETHSYYGKLNIPAFNVGYHNEHHDLPSVPWNNLPKLKANASEFYENLFYYKSWVKLFFKFIFDPKFSLFSRMIRSNRGGVSVSVE